MPFPIRFFKMHPLGPYVRLSPPSRAQELARQALDPASQASEPARHASEPVKQASEPARQASEPGRQASEALREVTIHKMVPILKGPQHSTSI